MAGIYIHIPFCKQACTYCNFHFSTSLRLKADLLLALGKEIVLTGNFRDVSSEIETIYFGGGTPSILSPAEIQGILYNIRQKFKVARDAEITLEANPDDINSSILQNWLQIGINRLSLGIQSFNQAELKWMNRAHNASQSLRCITEIKQSGFTNFSVDLIYGSPLQSNDNLIANVNTVFSQAVPHISCYALTVEPKTALDKMITAHRSLPVDPDKQAEQFQLLLNLMENAGYEQYEISNFSKPGFRSWHNSSYWQGKPYYGFGPAAHSFDGRNTRRWNIANNVLYIQSLKNDVIPFEEEKLTSVQRLNEYIMTAIRTVAGIDIQKVRLDFGDQATEKLLHNSSIYITRKHMVAHNGFLILTKEGKFLADGIASNLFFDEI